MPDHYYSKKPQSEFIAETHQHIIRNRTYTFTSSTGVFSKHRIDFGTKLLIESFIEPEVEGDLLDLGCNASGTQRSITQCKSDGQGK